MLRHERERAVEQRLARLHPVPGRGARRMRQRDAIDRVTAVIDFEFLPDGLEQRALAEKLRDRELPHRQHEGRFQQRELALEPGRAVRDLVRRRHAVAALGALARKAAAHRGEINPVAHLVLGPAERGVEPLEQRLARRPCEGPAEFRLLVARRLADKHDATRDGAPDDDRLVHPRTTLARAQRGEMFFDRRKRGHKKVRTGRTPWKVRDQPAPLRCPRPPLACKLTDVCHLIDDNGV